MQTELPSWTRRVLGARDPAGEPAALASPPQAGAAAPESPPPGEPVPQAAEPERPATFIEAGCELEGHLVLSHSIELSGEFRGSITCPETVVVGDGADVAANIRARSIAIRGSVVGDLEATREILISGSGRLQGSISTPSLVIERGAVFNGQTRMFRPELEARARQASPPQPGETRPTGA